MNTNDFTVAEACAIKSEIEEVKRKMISGGKQNTILFDTYDSILKKIDHHYQRISQDWANVCKREKSEIP